MARPRTQFHEILESIDGVVKAYFNPPESVKMKYPCVRYKIDGADVKRADNVAYGLMPRYSVTVIDRDPDSSIYLKLMDFPYSSLERCYTADNLHHWVFSIYY